ncbi:hypothetical protein BkAM31D_06670 [Halalkalibacter krulwichiae]|uniref:DUF1795 domain-containing protein n=2 Tax=Halalkalibacter krulwichiae TaxID=199441 RepID=A0A1X9M815_9BACI|nr:hypothetical protein BkAM31D_06670 [Halalkalibacter krulwichiae]
MFVIAAACEANPAETKTVIYENKEAGIVIYQSSNWELEKEVSIDPLNAAFKQDHMRAIVSIIPNAKTVEQIKAELNLEGDFVQMIEETEDSLSFKITQTEETRSDIFVKTADHETIIVTFFTPLKNYQTNSEKIDDFKDSIARIY